MGIILYELRAADPAVRQSPYCWRIRLALAHKGLPFETVPVTFGEIKGIGGGMSATVPVLDDNGKLIRDSWDIAIYLEEAYPDRPSLFGGAVGVGLSEFAVQWGTTLSRLISPMIMRDLYDRVAPEDRNYFRESREKRYGMTLEAYCANRDADRIVFRERLAPLRQTLAWRPFVGGQAPVFADYAIFSHLQWARLVSPYPILADDDPVKAWFERCLDLHDGMGRRMPAAS